jgi:DNA-binding protein HU-alpha
VDVHIRRLRKALGEAYENLVQTVRGTGKNPQTGEPVKIKASNTVAFKPGKSLKDTVNA